MAVRGRWEHSLYGVFITEKDLDGFKHMTVISWYFSADHFATLHSSREYVFGEKALPPTFQWNTVYVSTDSKHVPKPGEPHHRPHHILLPHIFFYSRSKRHKEVSVCYEGSGYANDLFSPSLPLNK